MINYEQIRDVHLEVSTLCNAICPKCPRNFHGYPHNDGYPELNLTFAQAKKIFKPDFLKQLTRIYINGNFGDIVMNPESLEIVEYFKKENPTMRVLISTNGGARSASFWQGLANAGATVMFCIDGLEDTHHLYRQNTAWNTVIKNATAFIGAGGNAIWKMIKFNHNQHQIELCKEMSKNMGFYDFQVVEHGRDTGPVFNKSGELTHILGDYTGPTDFHTMFFVNRSEYQDIKNYKSVRKNIKSLSCDTINKKSIYIAANGDVTPCCFTGMYPKSYGVNNYMQVVNNQIAPLVSENNALKFDLEHCIKWFSKVQQAWQQKEYTHGRLLICDDVCGR